MSSAFKFGLGVDTGLATQTKYRHIYAKQNKNKIKPTGKERIVMTIKLWLGHKKYMAKKWLREHRAHILATISTGLLIAVTIYWGSNALANFIDTEFIQPAIAQNLTK